MARITKAAPESAKQETASKRKTKAKPEIPTTINLQA